MKAYKLLGLSGLFAVLRRPLALAGLSLLVLATAVVPARATAIVNGSFENTGGATASYEIDSSNLPGWSNGASTPQILNCLVLATDIGDPCGVAAGNSGDVFWANPTVSPDGGDFIAIDADPSFSVALTQMLGGLVDGDIYQVSFYQGAAQFKAVSGPTTDYWQVTLGGEVLDSSTMDDASKGVVGWESQSLDFTATSASELLSFFAVGTPSGGPPTALLDGVSITDITQIAQTTPEPSLWGLVAAALVGIILVRRRQHQRS
jgi:hypothetical protein